MIRDSRLRVGLLGGTGLVGQRFIQLLDNHPIFELAVIGASERSSKKTYQDAVSYWSLGDSIPENIKCKRVVECKVENFGECKLIFSALDASVAREIEDDFANAGFPIFSNSKAFRMDERVPLVVPLVNHDHINMDILKRQERPKSAFIITNANCSTTGLAVAVKPLYDAFGIKKIMVNTMQAISGAGYPGVSSLSIIDNVIPFICGEEEKMEIEILKILSSSSKSSAVNAPIWNLPDITVSASCNRVNVIDGHTINVSIEFSCEKKPSLAEIVQVIESFNVPNHIKSCPSSPSKPIILFGESWMDRPQPRLDRFKENGMAIAMGRLRECPILDVKFTCLVHNTILGAAGSAILNAEIAVEKTLID